MFFYAITGLINAATSLILGIFVYSKNRKNELNKKFGLFAFSVAIWSFGYFFWQIAKEPQEALFWSRVLMAGTIFIPVFYFDFVLRLINNVKRNKNLLIFGYIASFIFFLLNFTPLFVRDVTSKLSFPFWPEPGILFHFFLLMFFGYTAWSWYLMIGAYKKFTGMKRKQIKFVLIGTLVGFIGGSTNYFLWYNIPILPIGNGLVSIYVILVTYAILKHHLMNIRVIATELFTGLIILILLVQTIIAPSFDEFLIRGGVFLFVTIFGFFLIRGTLKEIETLEKLTRAKSEFVSIVSHQLRTPLTAIKGYMSMLIEGSYGKLPKKSERVIGNVYESNERLIRLVNNFLNISRIKAGKLEMAYEKTSLEEMIEGIISELKLESKKKKLYLKLEQSKKPVPQILVDAEKIRQIILNVIDNCIRYTKQGGIVVKVKNLRYGVLISIIDTGEGMTEEEVTKVFHSFSRGSVGNETHTEGAGLGLYIARKFAEMHKGKIWAESKGRGKGSTFYIELPKKPKQMA
ncbi:hypothetical protein KAR26_00585 [Candidatus Parcubacteria bacterium]|nr:hypothetical protein [Candidatus Parcubacteria bacterium]